MRRDATDGRPRIAEMSIRYESAAPDHVICDIYKTRYIYARPKAGG